MRKGFTRKPKLDEPATPVKNYITPSGLERLTDEHRFPDLFQHVTLFDLDLLSKR